jgi:hypothetical protein
LSIIYDALKKSQKTRAIGSRLKIARIPKNRRAQMIAVLLFLTSLFVVVATIKLSSQPTKAPIMQGARVIKQSAPLQTAAANVVAPRLLLDGVFLSDKEKLAMINHRAYHEGDLINGMQIVSIAFDEVTLKNNARSLTLRSSITQFD